MASTLSDFICFLHDRAESEGRVPGLDDETIEMLSALRYGDTETYYGPQTDEVAAGLEIYAGRPQADLARKIQRRALKETKMLELVLQNVDDTGYTAISVRALLVTHWEAIQRSQLGSDENCAYLDLKVAIGAATERTRIIAMLLIAGLGPSEIGERLGTNGVRHLGRAVVELARILNGG